MSEIPVQGVIGSKAAPGSFWPRGWWRLMDRKFGIVPVPVFFAMLLLVGGFVYMGKIPSGIPMAVVVLTLGGFACAEIGKRLPVLKNIGAPAILATFIPSALAYYRWPSGGHIIPDSLIVFVTEFSKSSNLLYLFIASIIVGSILGMDRHVLIAGFFKIFIPLGLGSVVAACVGVLVGMGFGMTAHHAFFFVIIPIMAGGVGEGAIPLSIGYAAILQQPQGEMFAQVLPPVMMGSLTAVLAAGTLNYVGKRYPHLTGEGKLQPDGHAEILAKEERAVGPADLYTVGGAMVMAMMLYLMGELGHVLFGFPAPITMLFLAVVLKLTQVVSPSLQQGSFQVYKFFSTAVTYPLLFAIGVSITPWDKLIAAFHIANVVTIVSTVLTLMATGFVVGRFLKLYPIEAAIVNACHSGQGGTGDVAILTAANRMALMPFAQIATRIGGALTVTLTLILLSRLS